jgi:hypothetical protein
MYAVTAGAPTLFTGWPGAIPVSEEEIASAGALADVALVSMTVALIICSRKDRRNTVRSSAASHAFVAVLSEKMIQVVSAVAFPIGIVALLAFGNIPNIRQRNIDLGAWNTSSWTMVTQFWPGLVLLALIYFYGFRRNLMVPMYIFLALMSIQGYNRFRVLLPIIFLLITWQTRKGLKWPKKWMVISFVCLAILSFSMKQLGWMVQEGQPLSDAFDVASEQLVTVLSGSSDDQKLLDMFASVRWLVDESGRHFYGTMYYPLLAAPVPRQLWPEKPSLNWYWTEIDSPARPMYQAGMVANILGEAYANFGFIGVAVVPFVVGYWLGRFYFTAMRESYYSIYRFMYVTVACCVVQVFRDGLFSAVIFPLVNMMPLVAIAVFSYIVFRRQRASSLLHSPFTPGRKREANQAQG